MFPSRINPSAFPQSSRQQGEPSRNQTRPSILSAQQIAQHLQQLSGQNNAFEASLGDSALPVQHITSETMRQQELAKVLNTWIDQLPWSDKDQGQKLASTLQRKPSGIKTFTFTVKIGSTLPDIFPFFQHLENLTLDTPHQTLPESLGTLKNLHTLSLSANGLQAFPESLTQLSKLRSLSLHNFTTLPPFPQDAGKLTNLKTLNVLNYSKENALPANTHLLPKLRDVHLSSCWAIGNAFQQLQANKGLKKLSFHFCSISTEQWYHIKALQALNTLEIASPRLPAFLPEDLFPMPRLTQLRLEFNTMSQLPNSITQQKNSKN